MSIVYGASASPFVRKVRIVLAEKNVPYEHETVFPGSTDPEFRQMSPLGKIPAFRDGDRTLADSSVISAYVERLHPTPALYPTDAYDYARALWFEEYADGGMVPVFGAKIFFQRIVGPRFFGRVTDEAVVEKAISEELPPLFDYLEGAIGTRQFLVGDGLTIADIGVASPFVNLRHAGVAVDAARWPHLAAYVRRMHERPSFAALIAEEAPQFS
ncbi:MAG: glutathione S-transferase family protein [bacterium]